MFCFVRSSLCYPFAVLPGFSTNASHLRRLVLPILGDPTVFTDFWTFFNFVIYIYSSASVFVFEFFYYSLAAAVL